MGLQRVGHNSDFTFTLVNALTTGCELALFPWLFSHSAWALPHSFPRRQIIYLPTVCPFLWIALESLCLASSPDSAHEHHLPVPD